MENQKQHITIYGSIQNNIRGCIISGGMEWASKQREQEVREQQKEKKEEIINRLLDLRTSLTNQISQVDDMLRTAKGIDEENSI